MLREDAATFDVLRQMREDILCCVLKPDQRLRFGELRQRYDTVGRHPARGAVASGVGRAGAHRGGPRLHRGADLAGRLPRSLGAARLSRDPTLADAIRHGTDAWEAEIVSSYFLLNKLAPPRQDDPVSVKREWGKRHKRFHDSLVATCTSPWSLHFRSELFDQARRYHWLTMIHARSRRRNEHLDLRDAVLARDVDLACGLIEKHIRTTVEQAASEVPGLTMEIVRIAKRQQSVGGTSWTRSPRRTSYDIGGVRYPQPFKIRRLGHFGFNVADLQGGIDFYSKLLGFRITDTRDLKKIPGREEMAKRLEDGRIVFMSHNSDHHAFLLAHKSLGAIFGDDAVAKDITVNQITWQVGTMDEVFAAADYFQREAGRDPPRRPRHAGQQLAHLHPRSRRPHGRALLRHGADRLGRPQQARGDVLPRLPRAARAAADLGGAGGPRRRRQGHRHQCRQHDPGPQRARSTSSPACGCRGRSRSPTSGR